MDWGAACKATQPEMEERFPYGHGNTDCRSGRRDVGIEEDVGW